MKFIRLLAILIFGFTLSFAISKDQIKPVMEEEVNEAVKILQDKSLDQNSKAGKIFNLFDEYFDYALMAKISLSKYYSTLSEAEAKEFNEAYEKALKNSFIYNLKEYKDQEMKVVGVEEPRKNRVVLKTKIISSEKDYPVDFKFYPKTDSNWLIYDIDILGVSIVQTYRSQFESLTKNGNFEQILKKLNSISINAEDKK